MKTIAHAHELMHFGLWITNTADHPSPLGAVWEQPERRFSPTIEETAPCFIVRDHNGQALAFVHSEWQAMHVPCRQRAAPYGHGRHGRSAIKRFRPAARACAACSLTVRIVRSCPQLRRPAASLSAHLLLFR